MTRWLVICVATGGVLACTTKQPEPPPSASVPQQSTDTDRAVLSEAEGKTFLETLPKSHDGKPILVPIQDDGILPGAGLVYDERLDDPITRWGQCLSKVRGCYSGPGESLGKCVARVPACAGDRGGHGCCPPSCIRKFSAAVASGQDPSLAIDQSFIDGACVEGFASMLEGSPRGAK